jgi:hypothetical protein
MKVFENSKHPSELLITYCKIIYKIGKKILNYFSNLGDRKTSQFTLFFSPIFFFEIFHAIFFPL